MKPKKLKEDCLGIYGYFGYLESGYDWRGKNAYESNYPIQAFAMEIIGGKLKKLLDLETEEFEDKQFGGYPSDQLVRVGFALGYAIGQKFDTSDIKVQKAIENIMQVLKEKKLLPYFIKGKKR